MDFALPAVNGAMATRQILRAAPDTAVLMLSMHSEMSYVRASFDAGARGYLLKNAMDLELVDAVKQVAAGRQVLDPLLGTVEALEQRAAAAADAARSRGAATDRPRQVEQGNRRRCCASAPTPSTSTART